MLNYGRHLLKPLNVGAEQGQDDKVISALRIPSAANFAGAMLARLNSAKASLHDAKTKQKAHYDKKHGDVHVITGDYVCLNTANLQRKGLPSRKLMLKYAGLLQGPEGYQ